MAVHARAEVTITADVEAMVMWYQLTSSANKPAKPTTTSAAATPAGWTKAEPAYTGGSTSYLHTCLQAVWADGTCSWGEVQLSSSYEAAKAAWNKAQAAADAAAATAQHFWHDSGGAHVSTVAGSTATGDAATLTGGALTFTSGGDEVASFGRTLINLGRWLSTSKVGDTATINLMGGSGSIVLEVGENRDRMTMDADAIVLDSYDDVVVRTSRGYSGMSVNGKYVMVEPDVLYSSTTGTTGTVTLSASAAGYDHMRIYYRCGSGASAGVHASVDLWEPDGKRASLSALRAAYDDESVATSSRVVLVSGTSITDVNHSQSVYGKSLGVNTVNDIHVYRVEAWRSVSYT